MEKQVASCGVKNNKQQVEAKNCFSSFVLQKTKVSIFHRNKKRRNKRRLKKKAMRGGSQPQH
jgi:hypothetical protein